MRISRVRIGSFGGVRDRDYRLDGGMTVLYGPNESGKTSTMEFIRSVLVPYPRAKKNAYPVRSRTDSGTVDFEEDGAAGRLELSAREVTGTRPQCLEMDPDLYRQMFAMDARSLDDADAITQGSIKSRFLTLPGGEGMPAAIEWAEDSTRKILGLKSNSPSELVAVEREIRDLEASVSEARSKADSYGELANRLGELRKELERLGGESRSNEADRDLHTRYESNRGNYEDLARLREERFTLGDFVLVTQRDIDEKNELDRAYENARGQVEALERQQKEAVEELGDIDRRRVSRNSQAIKELAEGLPGYRRDREELSRPRPEPARAAGRKGLLIVGAAVAALGIALCALSTYAIVVAVAGAGLAAYGYVSGSGAVSADPVMEETEKRVSRYEDDVRETSDALQISARDPIEAVERMSELLDSLKAVSQYDVPIMKANNVLVKANNDRLSFLVAFSGEEGFARSVALTARAAELDGSIAAVERAIRGAGLDPDVPDCPVQWVDNGADGRREEVSREIGRIQAEMSAILDMGELESMMDRLQVLRTERARILEEGASAVLAGRIAEIACTAAYGGVQPGVMGAADRYFRMMTGGDCSLRLDPLTNEMTIESEDGTRDMGRWSSGLRAQAMLSVKLAVAREMGGGRVPVILDDVLLPFDSERKEGALRALASISGEMQVVMFTCDAETRDTAERLGITVVGML